MITAHIPAAIRACSPVSAAIATSSGDVFFATGATSVVSEVEDGQLYIEGGWFDPSQWEIIISDPTGAAHLAWYLRDTGARYVGPDLEGYHHAMRLAFDGQLTDPDLIRLLGEHALRVSA